MKKYIYLMAAFAGASFASAQEDGQITGIWGTETVFAEYRAADGAVHTNTNDILFQLGVFTGITPTADNPELWRDNWVPLYTESVDALGRVTGTVNFGDNSPTDLGSIPVGPASTQGLTGGQQLYVWGFQQGQESFDPSSGDIPEWVLFTGPADANNDALATGNWVLPNYRTETGGDPSLLTNHNPNTVELTAFNQTEAIFGTVSFNGTADDFIQFESVPEPSSTLLIGLAALALGFRRNR